jgi:DNA polymerase III subunit epsilon
MKKKYVIFDTETTDMLKRYKGLNDVTQPYIIQLCWMIIEGKKSLIKDYYIKLPETVSIQPGAQAVHGISKEYLNEHGQDMSIVMNEFLNDMKDADYLVSHNIDFDIDMIKIELIRMNILPNNFYPEKCKLYCTMKNGKDICNIILSNSRGQYIKNPKLIELYQKLFTEEPVNLHCAKSDTIYCGRCFYKMKRDKDLFEKHSNIKNLVK